MHIESLLINNAEDLDIAMLMYNLIGYSKNYSNTLLLYRKNYARDISIDPITNSESFKCKESITGKTTNDGNTKDVEFSVPLKHLSNSWKTLDMPLFNCEVSLTSSLSRHCAITNKTTRDADVNVNPTVLETRAPTCTIFKVKDIKLYELAVTLSNEDDNKLLEQSKSGFKRTIKQTKQRSEMTKQPKTKN